MRVLAVIPAFNEQGKVGSVVRKVPPDSVDQILVVDDCSTDRTADEAREAGAEVRRHASNQGVGAAIRTGIDHALSHGFDVVVVLSGDDQHEPQELSRVLEPLRAGRCDFVQGSRWLPGGAAPNITRFRARLTRLYAWSFRRIINFPCTDGTNGFRAFRTALFRGDRPINVWQDWLNTYELEPYLLYSAIREGYRVVEVPVTVYYPVNRKGFTKMKPLMDWWRILRPLVFLRLGFRR